jgi:outer membrane autotransporter protein
MLPTVNLGDAPVPIYRPETPLYSALMPVVMNMGLETVSTFHDRQGSQILLTEDGTFPATWARVWGTHHEQSWSGDAHPAFDGSLSGVQIGQDLWARQWANGQRDHAGLFYSYSNADGDVDGLILGEDGRRAGKLKMNANSVGGYWTHLLANNAYLDAVAMYSWLDGSLNSIRQVGGDTSGNMFTGSLELGYPFSLSERWSLEPQAQFIGQHVSLDDINDGIAKIRWDDGDRYTGRIGARLVGSYGTFEPYLKANLWHDFQQAGWVNIGADAVGAQYESTSLELGMGAVAELAHNTHLSIALSHTNDLDGEHREDYSGTLGLRINW